MALWSRELAVLAEDPSQHPHDAYNSNSKGANAFFDLRGLLYTHDTKKPLRHTHLHIKLN